MSAAPIPMADSSPSHRSLRPTSKSVDRCFQMPELFLAVLAFLPPDIVDLLALSGVSKRTRSIALPLLVRHASIPLSRIASAALCFERNSGLSLHVRCLRLWDDIAHRHFRYVEGDIAPTLPLPTAETYSPLWPHLHRFFALLAEGGLESVVHLRIDLSWGLGNLFALREALTGSSASLAERVTALRIIVDQPKSEADEGGWADGQGLDLVILDDADAESQHSDRDEKAVEGILGGEAAGPSLEVGPTRSIQTHFDDLAAIVHAICDLQDAQGTQLLHTFHLDDYTADRFERPETLNCVDHRFFARLACRIRDFSYAVPCKNVKLDGPRGFWSPFWKLFEQTWTSIRCLRLRIFLSDLDHMGAGLHNLLIGLWAHAQVLEEVLIDFDSPIFPFAYHNMFGPVWGGYSLPSIKKCAVSVRNAERYLLKGFAETMRNVVDLTLTDIEDVQDSQLLARYTDFVKPIRILRAQASTIRTFLDRGAQLRHIQVMRCNRLWSQNEPVTAVTLLGRKARPSVTCLDLQLEHADMDGQLERTMAKLVGSRQLPNLVELLLDIKPPAETGLRRTAAAASSSSSSFASHRKVETSEESAGHLAALLDVLSTNASSKLRALRIQYDFAWPLPLDDAHLSGMLGPVPPALEYLTWHAPLANRTQYYRVSRTGGDGSVRLQGLPAAFRLVVDPQTGIWTQPSEIRHDFPLFDHVTEGEPRLKHGVHT
ncbi:hypothetical protein OC844_000251 [Tilletia horrida]|nr:hypothetical protein OC844_000251 [Tilletia horrida]